MLSHVNYSLLHLLYHKKRPLIGLILICSRIFNIRNISLLDFKGLIIFIHITLITYNTYNSEPTFNKSGANTKETMVINLIKMLIDGPEVSLNGSPTVSPTTDALWASEPLPP